MIASLSYFLPSPLRIDFEVNPMISLIIPCYNAQESLSKCFNSILNQTIDDYEVIFINDGSTDGTWNLLHSIQSQHPDKVIRLLSQSNQGVSAARNQGIKNAQGHYITFIDADDELNPTFLEVLLSGINKADLAVVGIGGDGYKAISSPYLGTITSDHFIYEFWMTHHLWGSTCNKLYRRDLIVQHNILFDSDISIMEDMLFNLHYCQRIKSIYVNNQPLYLYHRNPNSKMQSAFSPKSLSIIKAFHSFLNLNLNQEELKIIQLHQVSGLLWLLKLLYKSQNPQTIARYEPIILNELASSNRRLFFFKGWKKGITRYSSFLLYTLHPALLKKLIHLFYRVKAFR